MKRTRIVFVAVSVTFLLSAAGLLMAKKGQNEELYRALGSLAEVVHLVHTEYVDEVDLGALALSLEAGIVQSIDTGAAVLPKESVEAYKQLLMANPPFGLVFGMRLGSAAVRATIEGSPAAGAGLERWEVIELVDGVNTRGRPLWQIRVELMGKERDGQSVKLTVLDQQVDERRDVVLVPASWKPELPIAADEEVAVAIRLTHLGKGSSKAVREMITSDRPVILDLRELVWGFEDEAIKTADLFAGEGVLAQWRGRRAGEKVFPASQGRVNGEQPIVLVNHNTQGVGEILAAALQRSGASLVGTKTAGRAHHMRLIHDQDLYLWLPVAHWLREDDEPITRNGVEPDFEVESSGDDFKDGADPILDKALSLVRERLEAAA
jgi:C-terminal processing protease CtpA/Prc